MKIICTFLISFIITFLYLSNILSMVLPDEVSVEWVANFAEPDSSNRALNVTFDNSGNVYIVGVTGFYEQAENDSIPIFKQDYAIIKYDSFGSLEWVNRQKNVDINFGPNAQVLVNLSGELYVISGTYRVGTASDYTITKYSPDGVELWTTYYHNYSWDNAFDMCMDNLNNIYIVGRSRGVSTADDIATIKIDSAGEIKWVRRIDGPAGSWDSSGDIAIDDSANIYISGFTNGIGTHRDIVTIKYDSAGQKIWESYYNGSANSDDWAGEIKLDKHANVYVCGTCFDTMNTQKYILLNGYAV